MRFFLKLVTSKPDHNFRLSSSSYLGMMKCFAILLWLALTLNSMFCLSYLNIHKLFILFLLFCKNLKITKIFIFFQMKKAKTRSFHFHVFTAFVSLSYLPVYLSGHSQRNMSGHFFPTISGIQNSTLVRA